MTYYLEQIKTMANGTTTAELAKHPDELTATIFFHRSLDTNLRMVQSKELKAFYANVHTDAGAIVKSERWENKEEAPEA